VRGKDAGESRLEASFDTGTQTFSGVIGGNTTGQNNIGFSKTGNGTQVLSGNTANTFTGLTNIDGGILSLAKNDGVNAIGGHAHVDSGTLQIAASEQIADNADVTIMGGAFAFAGSGKTETIGTFRNNGGNFTTGANTLIGTGNSIYFNGGTTTISNGGSTQDAHYLITAGTNTVEAGGTLEVLSGGLGLQFGGTASPTLNLASSNDTAGRVLLNSNLEVLSTSTSGTAQILSTGIGSNKGSIDLGGAPRTFTVNNGSAGTDLLISANIINGSLVKSGLGTLELAAANSYTGTTTVTAGTLSVTGSTGAGAVAIDSGATLTGNGKVGGVTNVTGVLAPGTGLATLTFGQSLTLAGAATTEFELDALNQAAGGGFNDLIAVGIDSAGDLALDGIINLTAWDAAIFTGFTADDHVKWTLFTYTGNLTIGNNLSFGSTPTLGFDSLGRAQSWVLDTTSTSGKVYATVIPEPSTMLLGAIGAAGLILRRRRR
jgi:autotransporter-associated beta strand protein